MFYVLQFSIQLQKLLKVYAGNLVALKCVLHQMLSSHYFSPKGLKVIILFQPPWLPPCRVVAPTYTFYTILWLVPFQDTLWKTEGSSMQSLRPHHPTPKDDQGPRLHTSKGQHQRNGLAGWTKLVLSAHRLANAWPPDPHVPGKMFLPGTSGSCSTRAVKLLFQPPWLWNMFSHCFFWIAFFGGGHGPFQKKSKQQTEASIPTLQTTLISQKHVAALEAFQFLSPIQSFATSILLSKKSIFSGNQPYYGFECVMQKHFHTHTRMSFCMCEKQIKTNQKHTKTN